MPLAAFFVEVPVPNDLDDIAPPPLALTALEPLRTGVEYSALMMSLPHLMTTPRGDGHGVLVLPGFAMDDDSTTLLRGFLRMLGCDVHPWRLGWNLDHKTTGHRAINVMREIDKLVESTAAPVSLIGWSLGGVIARDTARRIPKSVRQVISIGSPFTGNPNATNVKLVYEWLSGNKVDSPTAMRRFAIGPLPLPMPSTSFYSKSDGITAWQNCVLHADERSENVEVACGHFGLVVSPAVFKIVANRLAQPLNGWQPFNQKTSS